MSANEDKSTGDASQDRFLSPSFVDPSEVHLDLSPLIQRSLDKFRKDLPQLLEKFPRQWVAYRGDERLGVSISKRQLYQECLRRGLQAGTFLVRSIEPEVSRELVDRPDV